MNIVLMLCLMFILSHHLLLAFVPPLPQEHLLALLLDATPLPRVEIVAQGLSREVGPAVAIMRLTLAVVVEFILLPPHSHPHPHPLITSLPLPLLNHNYLHSHRLLHHLPRRRFAAPNATIVPSTAYSNSGRLHRLASSWLDPSSIPLP